MISVGKRLGKLTVSATAIGTADVVVANLTGKDTCVTALIAYNSDTSARTLYLCQVDDNAGAVDTAIAADVFLAYAIDPGETIFLGGSGDLRIWLNDVNDTIQAYASVANVINLFLYGIVCDDQE